MTSDLIGTAEMAKVLGCCVRTIYFMIQHESIPYYKIGPTFRFDREAVLQALAHERDKTEVNVSVKPE